MQRAIRSGRGRPMAFLKMSVRKEVVRRERQRPRRTTWVLWTERLGRMRDATRRSRAGIPRAYRKSMAVDGELVLWFGIEGGEAL